MGKALNGKELGNGLSQRKDGRYSARYTSKTGKRVEKYFKSLSKARTWLNNARSQDAQTPDTPFEICAKQENPFDIMTVDEWFTFWHDNLITNLTWNTRRNYRERYENNIKPMIGSMNINMVKPMHCKAVFNKMIGTYAGSTIAQAYITLGTVFRAAVMNGIIDKHPMDGLKYDFPIKPAGDIKCLTIEEQEKFLVAASRSHNYIQYLLILETGLRTGELIGLTWDAVDLEKRTITINKTLEYRHCRGTWEAGSPKTLASYRTIPLTTTACELLRAVYLAKDSRKMDFEHLEVLKYVDRRTGVVKQLDMRELVFLNWRTGMPNKNSSYDTHLYKMCDEAGIKRIGMHVLRHTYATRAIERGMQPKVLQELLGHASIKTTMDTYVHVTDDAKQMAVLQFEKLA